MINVILIAPPASGKGTQGDLIARKHNIPHISTGKLLRDANDAELNKLIASGKLLSDEIVLGLLEKRLLQNDCKNGYVLDGFPRNIAQAKMYDQLLYKIGLPMGKVIFLNVSKDCSKKRIVGRLECSKCGAIYNDQFIDNKPKIENTCDKCGSNLRKRIDDSEEVFMKRYDEYLKETFPLVEYYKENELLISLDCEFSKEEVFEKIEKVIGE